MAVVGLDFGCLNAVMAQAERGGVTVLLNENSKRLNANLVSFQGSSGSSAPAAARKTPLPGARRRALLAGEAASSIARSNYKNTISCMKRFMGRKMSSQVAAEIARGVKFVEVDGLVGVEVMYDGEPKALSIPSARP
ncbi:ATP binding protein [Aureococcus anophagefferens]|nr:ATP binding protein [Aureococcus anophagefferens]